MRVAIIDLGTNSVRFDVHQLGPGKLVRQLHREKLMIRLGQGVFLEGHLDGEAIRRALHAFSSFARTCTELRVDKIIAFGTSALREASDGSKLLARVRTRTGIDVRVISGAEEARLIALGILSNEKLPKGRLALVDIGGGSTEVSITRGKDVLHCESFPLGTARLQQVFLKSSPPKAAAVEQLRVYIRSVLFSKMMAEGWGKADRIFGSSGTIRAIAKIVKKTGGGKALDGRELQRLIKQMSTMTTTQLLGIPGMEARRVDMILAGGVLLEECVRAIGAKKVHFTEYSLRDGILAEEIRLLRQNKKTHLAFHLEDLYAKAKRLGVQEPHLKQVVKISESLFDLLKPIHRLKNEWKTYLTAAAILHDVGEVVNPAHHEVHSFYIVKHADFPSMEKWETEFVARLCLGHQDGKVTLKKLGQFPEKPRRQAFSKLLAILRVADALDRGHKGSLDIKGVKIDRKAVRILISRKSATDLEVLRVEQKKALFERVFKKTLIVERA